MDGHATDSFHDLIGGLAPVEAHRPFARFELDRARWQRMIDRLALHGDWSLVGLWGEPAAVHVALRADDSGELVVVSLACPEQRFPSLSEVRPAAIRLERAARDLYGLEPEGLTDDRPWLDHGLWPSSHGRARTPYAFLPVEGEALHQIPVGPVHAGIIEPGHFRFTAAGETVARLEARLGYVHKGVEALMLGRTPDAAAAVIARLSGDSTVAYGLAFARAVEAALGTQAPPRAHFVRAVMAELERIANHLGDFGAICNDAAFTFLHAQAAALRELVLRASGRAFGHRLMMDRIVPGGVAADLTPEAVADLRDLIGEIGRRLAPLVTLYESKPSLQDRMIGTGVVLPDLVHRFGAGGYVGRAASRGFDARRSPSYPPYDDLEFEVPVFAEGDVNARVWVRLREIEQSLGLIEHLLGALPSGPVREALPTGGGEGMALIEAFRGEILCWVRLGRDGRIERCHPRDPSWFQWPLLEVAIKDNIVADFPLCNKSFNCSYSGHDL